MRSLARPTVSFLVQEFCLILYDRIWISLSYLASFLTYDSWKLFQYNITVENIWNLLKMQSCSIFHDLIVRSDEKSWLDKILYIYCRIWCLLFRPGLITTATSCFTLTLLILWFFFIFYFRFSFFFLLKATSINFFVTSQINI